MGPEVIFVAFTMLIGLVLLGVHIGVALGATCVFCLYLIYGDWSIALSILGATAYESIRTETLAVIPLFVLMGEIASRAGAAKDLYRVCDHALRGLPGRLAAATVFGNAAFAAVSGVSIASAATFSRIAYPEMMALGYQKKYALGVIAGSACLGMLIPPSVLLIVWAILTEGSVGALFLAGVGPGLLLAAAFVGFNVFAALVNPAIAPSSVQRAPESDTTRLEFSAWLGGLGVILLVVLVLGGIWGGAFTPTEAAGFGVIGACLIAVLKGLGPRGFIQAIINAGRTTAPIMFLLIAGAMYARLLALSGGLELIDNMFASAGLTLIGMVLVIAAIWLVLGALIDSISIILLTTPIFAPMAAAAGIDPTAFAIFAIMIIEAGLLTPPVGLLVYTVQASAPDSSVTLGEIFAGSVPYWILILLVAALVLLVPGLATWLPNLLL